MKSNIQQTNGKYYYIILINFLILFNNPLLSQDQGSSRGFNYFPRSWYIDSNFGSGFSIYSAVFSIMEKYPGANGNFQMGLVSQWMGTLRKNTDPDFYHDIEGGLGWWEDTRFATETPKFIMGGVAYNFNQWANGTGAGSSSMINEERDWSVPEGKYGVAQLSNQLLWPPDGLNLKQGLNGEFLGYGYYPLPLTDPIEKTYGKDFSTGNQCWTLFFNTTNFKGPATFFLPTFWTETVLDNPSLQGLFLDTRGSDSNLAFAIEHASSPSLIGMDVLNDLYAKILPFHFPNSTTNKSELIRELKVYSKSAKWDDMNIWFNGGSVPSTKFNSNGLKEILFLKDNRIDGNISSMFRNPYDFKVDFSTIGKIVNLSQNKSAGFEWNTAVVNLKNEKFQLPEYYKLNKLKEIWEPIKINQVPSSTGLLSNMPSITPRKDEYPYKTPIEKDSYYYDSTNNPWRNPGPVSGPHFVNLGDGSTLTYYWYKFIDQPSIIHANYSSEMRLKLQQRIEKIHSSWGITDEYLPELTEGNLAAFDSGLITKPPRGLEVGYVPIVTRQEKYKIIEPQSYSNSDIIIYPNPSSDGIVNIQTKNNTLIKNIKIFDLIGKFIGTWEDINSNFHTLDLGKLAIGGYILNVSDSNNKAKSFKVILNNQKN